MTSGTGLLTSNEQRLPEARSVPARAGLQGLVLAALDYLGIAVGADALPERVRRAVAALEARGEVLICFAQIGAILFFATVYAITPKAFPASVPFEPVPWTLAIYTAFTLVRLYLAIRQRLGRWFLRASVVVDIAVLMVTIWSFHLQYQAPIALSLKAPTVMYAFIMIALRALRFEAELVVLTGVAAITGWIILLLLALADGMAVTHSFAEYTMSHRILIGAEVDKILSIATVTAVLAVVILRARRLLVASVAEQQAATELSRFFSTDVAERIRGAEMQLAPGQGVLREAAILMTDLRGFTSLTSHLDPPAVMALLGEYQALVVPLVQRLGGSIDKYMGDGILASFGATRTSETFAHDALLAAEAILEAAAAWSESRQAKGQEPVGIGLAVATGRLLFGTTGDASRLEYTVLGEPVNLAAKLEKHTKVERARAVATARALELATTQRATTLRGWVRKDRVAVVGVEDDIDIVLRR